MYVCARAVEQVTTIDHRPGFAAVPTVQLHDTLPRTSDALAVNPCGPVGADPGLTAIVHDVFGVVRACRLTA